jgi:hypothetical protein
MFALGTLFVIIGVGKASMQNLQIIKNFLLCSTSLARIGIHK